MIPKSLRIPLRFLVVLPLLAVSCGGSDSNPIRPNQGAGLLNPVPVAEVPAINFNLEGIEGQDPRLAQQMCADELTRIATILSYAPALEAPLADARWGIRDGSCYEWTYPQQGCLSTYELCRQGDNYEWTRKANGLCGGADPWLGSYLYAGTMDVAGTHGAEVIRDVNSITPVFSWTWARPEGGGWPTWTYYDGSLQDGTFRAEVTSGTDSLDYNILTWRLPSSRRELRVSRDGTIGEMRFFALDSTSHLLHSISWDHGSGLWIKLDMQGTAIDTVSWPE